MDRGDAHRGARLAAELPLSAAGWASQHAIRDFAWLDHRARVVDADLALTRLDVGALPVFADERAVAELGRAAVARALHHGLGQRLVLEVAGAAPPLVAPEADASACVAALQSHGGRLLLVGTPGDRPWGLLTRTMVLRALASPEPPRPAPATLLVDLERALGDAWTWASRAAEAGEAAGSAVYLVGGPVRDALLGRAVADADLCVDGDAPALAEALAGRHGGRVRAHIPFRTAKWITPAGVDLDLASLRREWYEHPGALPRVEPGGLRQDLRRRDFSVNAMAVRLAGPDAGRLHDFFGGWRDLQAGRLAVLHGLSFHDDPTRVLRLARFSARFRFVIADDTDRLARHAVQGGALGVISLERAGAELHRLLAEPAATEALWRLADWGALTALIPDLDAERAIASLRARSVAPASLRADLGWFALASATPPARREAVARLLPTGKAAIERFCRGPERLADLEAHLLRARARSEGGHALSRLDPVELAWLEGASAEMSAWVGWWRDEGAARVSEVDGARLLREGVPPGPALGLGLRAARAAAWDGLDATEQLRLALEAAQQPPSDVEDASPRETG